MESAIRFVWNNYLNVVEPAEGYTFTPSRKQMIATRLRELQSQGLTVEQAINDRVNRAIEAFSNDDYFMGRKKGYEGSGRRGIDEIFKTQEVFEDWCAKRQSVSR